MLRILCFCIVPFSSLFNIFYFHKHFIHLGCYDIGPWDCNIGTPLTVEQCCTMIKASVPDVDVNGNNIDCYVDPPIGSISKPIDHGRVRIIVNEDVVVRPPKNE